MMQSFILERLSVTKSSKFHQKSSLKHDLMVTSWSLILLNLSLISILVLSNHFMNHFLYQTFPISSLHSF